MNLHGNDKMLENKYSYTMYGGESAYIGMSERKSRIYHENINQVLVDGLSLHKAICTTWRILRIILPNETLTTAINDFSDWYQITKNNSATDLQNDGA